MQSMKIMSLLEEAWMLRYTDPGSALDLSGQCLGIMQDEEDPRYVITAEAMAAVARFLLNRYEDVFEPLERAISFFERNPDHLWHSRFLVFHANACQNASRLSQAINSVKNAIKLAVAGGFPEILGDAYALLGMIYRNVGLFREALDAFGRSLAIRREQGESRSLASSLNQMGYCLASLEDYTGALKRYSESEELRLSGGFLNDLGYTYIGKASVYEKTGDNAAAGKYYCNALTIAEKFNDRRLECHSSSGLGRLSLRSGDLASASAFLDRALGISSSIGAKEMKQHILLSLSELHEKQGNYEKSLMSLKEHIRLKEETGVLETVSGLHRETIEMMNDLDASLRYAGRIQSAILPPAEYLDGHFESYFLLFRPFISGSIGGDFYFCQEKNGKLYFAAADCTGHGVPGAMMSMLAHISLGMAINEEHLLEPGAILDYCRDYFGKILRSDNIEGEVNDGMEIALCCYDRGSNKLSFAAAGLGLYQVRGDEFTEHKGNRGSISRNSQTVKFDTIAIGHEPGDIYYLFSDGFRDQFGGGDSKKFGSKRFRELILSVQEHALPGQLTVITHELNRWMGTERQVDDILLMGVRLKS